ncbi:MAG: DUF3320 domain-containing protein [Opitutaceae bacterium]|nr:DUF3320 domain-containing protein [Opitutaceae bacterium]
MEISYCIAVGFGSLHRWETRSCAASTASFRLARASGRGVGALKSFLRFAETGVLGAAKRSGKDEDSPFEEAVRQELEKHGLTVDTQVGEAGFFIDLAVRDEELNGTYILGIECDGATYHSSRSARDRDRLRQAVLEDHGWIIHRIWSTDWFQRPDRELRRVLIAVEKAREHARARSGTSKLTSIDVSPGKEIDRETVDRVPEEESDAPLYEVSELDLPAYKSELHEMNPGQLIRHVTKILEVEAPIHIDEIVLRLRTAWGYERAGNRIHEVVTKALRLAIAKSPFAVEEGFFVNKSKPATPRRRDENSPVSLRKPENFAPQEIRAAVVVVVERHLGVKKDEIAGAVARLFGFKATSPQIRATFDAQLRKLLKGGILREDASRMIHRASRANPNTPL